MSDLRFSLLGYASGGYGGTCVSCGTKFVGDKRAFQCLICAAVDASKRIAELEAQLTEAAKALEIIQTIAAAPPVYRSTLRIADQALGAISAGSE